MLFDCLGCVLILGRYSRPSILALALSRRETLQNWGLAKYFFVPLYMQVFNCLILTIPLGHSFWVKKVLFSHLCAEESSCCPDTAQGHSGGSHHSLRGLRATLCPLALFLCRLAKIW